MLLQMEVRNNLNCGHLVLCVFRVLNPVEGLLGYLFWIGRGMKYLCSHARHSLVTVLYVPFVFHVKRIFEQQARTMSQKRNASSAL